MASKQNLRDANAFYTCIRNHKELDSVLNSLPLVHFCDFLLQTLSVGDEKGNEG